MSGFLIKRTTQSKTASKAGPSAEIKGMCNYLFFPCTATFELELYRNEYSIPEGKHRPSTLRSSMPKIFGVTMRQAPLNFRPRVTNRGHTTLSGSLQRGFDHIVSSNKRSIIKAAEKKVAPATEAHSSFSNRKKNNRLSSVPCKTRQLLLPQKRLKPYN